MEDRIRNLCNDLASEADSKKAETLVKELRSQLHLHITNLRARLADYPHLSDQRQKPPPAAELYDTPEPVAAPPAPATNQPAISASASTEGSERRVIKAN